MAFYTYITAALGIFRLYFYVMARLRISRPQCVSNPNFYQSHIDRINGLVRGNDQDCLDQLWVNRHTFLRLCCLLRGVGLRDSRNVCLEERVAIFLWIVGHHTKQRRTKYFFERSGETVSRHFNVVLQAVLRLYNMLLVRPVPVAPNDGDSRWNWFQVHLCSIVSPYSFLNSLLVT